MNNMATRMLDLLEASEAEVARLKARLADRERRIRLARKVFGVVSGGPLDLRKPLPKKRRRRSGSQA